MLIKIVYKQVQNPLILQKTVLEIKRLTFSYHLTLSKKLTSPIPPEIIILGRVNHPTVYIISKQIVLSQALFFSIS